MDAQGIGPTRMPEHDGARGKQDSLVGWIARAAVAAVFAINVDCAFAFIAHPAAYASGFELTGVPGEAAVRGLGIAFLMWNATYPLVIWQPRRHRTLFGVVLAQQAIGLAGEAWLLSALPAGHDALASSITRFIVFDAAGLAGMGAAYLLLRASGPRRRQAGGA